MMRRKSHAWARVLYLLCILIGLLGIHPTQDIHATPASQGADRSLETLLSPDGTLDLSTGFSGTLDPAGWRMRYTEDGAPLFYPA